MDYETNNTNTEERAGKDGWLQHPPTLITLAAIGITLAVVLLFVFFFDNNNEKQASFEIPQSSKEGGVVKNPFASISISAKSAYVLDVRTGRVLYKKDEEAQLPLASIAKLMTAIVFTEEFPNESIVTIEPNDLIAEGDNGLVAGERWRAKDLLGFTLVVSSNDAALALANTAGRFFTSSMNKKAREIELPQTYFLNPTGLDLTNKVSGAYSSARDVVNMLHYILRNKPTLLEATREPLIYYRSLDQRVHVAKNTNVISSTIPGLIASKTGFTDLAGGNLVVAFDAGINHTILIAVLGSSFQGRFSDMKKLVSASFESLSLPPTTFPLQ